MTEEEAAKKIADFLSLMVQVTYYENKNGVEDTGEEENKCAGCKSSICAMIQRNNDLKCWRVYSKDPDKIVEDLSNSERHGRFKEVDSAMELDS